MEIEINNVSKKYGKDEVLHEINLSIGQGVFGVLGPNGAGKTTLLKLLTTVSRADSGSIEICGIPIEKRKLVREKIGYLPQDFTMYGNMTLYEALDYLAVLSGMKKKEREQKVSEMLKQVNLYKDRKKKVKEVSGGMKQRLGIAQAIIHDPSVIIVDEPTAGLDPEERVNFRNLLCEIGMNKSVILSTHIVGDIEATCEKIAVLKDGRIIFSDTVARLLDIAKGKTYRMEIGQSDLNKIKRDYLVSEIVPQKSGRAEVRIITESKPINGANLCNPNLEDAYLFMMQKESV